MTDKDHEAQKPAQDNIENLGKEELRAYADQKFSEINRIEGEYRRISEEHRYITGLYWLGGRAIILLAEQEKKKPHQLGLDRDYVTKAIAIADPKAFPNLEECAAMPVAESLALARERNPKRASAKKNAAAQSKHDKGSIPQMRRKTESKKEPDPEAVAEADADEMALGDEKELAFMDCAVELIAAKGLEVFDRLVAELREEYGDAGDTMTDDQFFKELDTL